jgi:hypothetical protein
MNILLVGALSWNPERIRTLHEHGHRLWGLWGRSMAWDQGPYPVLDGCVTTVSAHDAARVILDAPVDLVCGMLQVYGREWWGPPTPGIDADVWTLLRGLLAHRARGAIDVPFAFQWGFDVHSLDPDVVRVLDGQIFCNPEQRAYWTTPKRDGGAGYDCFAESSVDGPVVAFLDSDRAKGEFMTDDFAPLLSEETGEVHTVCVGRPFGIDYAALARNGIHLHVYGNGFDDTFGMIARDLVLQDASAADVDLACAFLHIHESQQTTGVPWPEVRAVKSRWVHEFSRYDAGWSYVGRPYGRPVLEDRSAIPNRVSTYLVAGLPVISDRRPGSYRYEELVRLAVNVDLDPLDYGALRTALEAESQHQVRRSNARAARLGYSFDATIPALIDTFEQVRERYHARDPSDRRRGVVEARALGAHARRLGPAMIRGVAQTARQRRRRWSDARLARRIRPVERRLRDRLTVVTTSGPGGPTGKAAR